MTGVFEDHLALDAIVAYADGELSLTAHQRAAAHLGRCPSCASEVAEQETMRQVLRSAALPRMPGSLFDSLTSIPLALPATAHAPTVPGVDRGPDGLMRHRTPVTAGRGRRLRFGAGALVAGLAVGAFVSVGPDADTDSTVPVVPAVADLRSD